MNGLKSAKSFLTTRHKVPNVLVVRESTNKNNSPFPRESETRIRSLEIGKASGIDDLHAELIKNGGNSVVGLLTKSTTWSNRKAIFEQCGLSHSSWYSPRKAIFSFARNHNSQSNQPCQYSDAKDHNDQIKNHRQKRYHRRTNWIQLRKKRDRTDI